MIHIPGVPGKINEIKEYPFSIGNLVVNALGKPTDWKGELENLHDQTTYNRLLSIARELGATRIFCPYPVHGTTISSSKIKTLDVSRTKRRIYREVKADGAEIDKEEAYGLASGDCHTVALQDPVTGKTIAIHFNRENGVDDDILSKALRHFRKGSAERLIAVITLGIDSAHFKHDWENHKHGKKNRRRTCELIGKYGPEIVDWPLGEGKIDLRRIAARKLVEAGLLPSNIYADLFDTYFDPRFWSHRASQTRGSAKFGEKGRNMVLVVNKG
ncbi:MAG: laccase domain-containing protein [Candidatus Campbellbacteria bacterium]|nr:laccase domain-containing protein [Candidatus Campbellbacteria bacterium]MDZ7726395.1 laccase domain-containing protein [Candidatus Campbellbacteria bacterium]